MNGEKTSTLHVLGFADWVPVDGQWLPNPARLLAELVNEEPFRGRLLEASGFENLSTGVLPVPQGPGGAAENFRIYRDALAPLLADVKDEDLVLGFGQHFPSRGDLALETAFANSFANLGKNPQPIVPVEGPRILEPQLSAHLEERVAAGALPGVALTQLAGDFFCNALGFDLTGRFPGRALFFHLHNISDPALRGAYWKIYGPVMVKTKMAQSAEDLACVSTEDTFDRLCGVLRVVREFKAA